MESHDHTCSESAKYTQEETSTFYKPYVLDFFMDGTRRRKSK